MFLLTNDDGIDAPGLEALARSMEGFGELVVIAPREEQSGCSHAATTSSPLGLEERGPNRYALNGTPADCVRVALHRFGDQLGRVVAGINSGGNLGVDVFHSGTVAAVREGLIHGLPGIAVSRYRSRALEAADWRRAAEWARPVLEELLGEPPDPNAMWNVNLPCLPAAAAPKAQRCALDLSPLGVEFREEDGLLHYAGEYRKRPREADRDVDVCFGGRISVTRLSLAP